MLAFHNQIQLVGRAGHNVELLRLTDGGYRASLRLYQHQRAAGMTRQSQVHHLIAWGRVAEKFAASIKRGDRLLVQGKLVNRKFTVNDYTTVRAEVHVAYFTRMASREVETSVDVAAEPIEHFVTR